MKRYIVLLFVIVYAFTSSFAQYEIRGGAGSPYKARNLNKLEVWLLNGMQGAQISFTSSSGEKHRWYRYETKANDAVPVESVQDGNTSVISDIQEGYGYFVGVTNSPSTGYVWIIDYSKYLPVFHSINISKGGDECLKLTLSANVDVPELKYFTPTGVYSKLEREFTLSYSSLKWEEESFMFIPKDVDELVNNLSLISIDAPLQDTEFTLTGDKFAEHFGLEKTISSPLYQAVAVQAKSKYVRDKIMGENEIKDKDQTTGGGKIPDLGGSAPIHITFNGLANEPVAGMYIWSIQFRKSDSAPWRSVARYTDKTIDYTFRDEGIFKVMLEVTDRKGVCVDSSNVYNVTIGETVLKIPKAFSPGSTPGVNDEFRVSYSSLISFKCTIFNRWGTKLYEWNDPAKGWDGRVNGRFVPTGVYFYVIQYKGTDGKSKTRDGSVNVLRAKY